MNDLYPASSVAATPEYVLSVIRDMHRQVGAIDPDIDTSEDLSFDTTVAEWRDACDLVGWKSLAEAYNQFWIINCSQEQWKAVLLPDNERRLRDVCQLVARHATRQMIRPVSLLGCTCCKAGAFLTVRSILSEAGANASEIAPSTLLAPYTRRYFEQFLGPISKLAPGALPPVRYRKPIYGAAVLGILLGMLWLVIGIYSELLLFTIIGALLLVFCYVMTWVASYILLPSTVTFGELRTFRDLAEVIDKEHSRTFA